MDAALRDGLGARRALTMSWDPIRITVSSSDADLLRAVRTRYARHLTTSEPGPGRGDVVCVVDSALYARLAESHADSATVAEVDDGGRAAVVRDGARHVVVANHGGPAAAVLVTRLVRAKAYADLYGAGWLPLHASSVVDGAGNAIVLVGPRMSGKTSLLLSLLDADAGSLLSNDSLFVQPHGSTLVSRALPVSLGIRDDVMRIYPQLKDLSDDLGKIHVDNTRQPHGPHDRVYAGPDLVAAAFGAELARTGKVKAVVAVSYVPEPDAFEMARVDDATAAETVETSRLDRQTSWASEWLDVPAAHAAGRRRSGLAVRELDVGFFRLRFGAGARSQATAELLELL
ncbi:MAG: hypothetical protein ACRDXX_21540 [Stackebrandtia sp.]